jgi:hypothetical protein
LGRICAPILNWAFAVLNAVADSNRSGTKRIRSAGYRSGRTFAIAARYSASSTFRNAYYAPCKRGKGGIKTTLTRLRPSHDFERHGLVRNAAEAAYLKVAVACVERVAQGRRGLSKAAIPEHPFIPSHHALGIKLRHTERLFVEREEWPTALRTGTDGRHDDRLPEANGGTATQLERPRAGDARRTYGFQIRSCRSRRFRPVAIGRRKISGLNIAGVCAICLALLSVREREQNSVIDGCAPRC